MRRSCADRDDDRDWRPLGDCSSQPDGLGPATMVSKHDEYNAPCSTNTTQIQIQIHIQIQAEVSNVINELESMLNTMFNAP